MPVGLGAFVAHIPARRLVGALIINALLVAAAARRLHGIQLFLCLVGVPIPRGLRRQWPFWHAGKVNVTGETKAGQPYGSGYHFVIQPGIQRKRPCRFKSLRTRKDKMNLQIVENPPNNLCDYVKVPPSDIRDEFTKSLVQLLKDDCFHICTDDVPLDWAMGILEKAHMEHAYIVFAVRSIVNGGEKGTAHARFYFERKKRN